MNAGADLQNSLIENLCRKYSSGRIIKTRAEVVESERARNIEKAELSAAEIVEFRDDEIEAFKEGGEYITSDCFAKMFRERIRGAHSAYVPENIRRENIRSEKIADNKNTSNMKAREISEVLKETEPVSVSTEYNSVAYDGDIAFDSINNTDDEYISDSEIVNPFPENKSNGSKVKIYEESSVRRSFLSTALDFVRGLPFLIIGLVEYDPKVLRVKKNRKAFPIIAFATVIIMAISLFLIVSSTVKLMDTNREVSELKKNISQMKAEESLIDSRLEEKENLAEFERIATEELGMIRSEYITAKRIPGDKDFGSGTSVKIYGTPDKDFPDKRNSGVFGTLLSALGFGK